MSLKEYSQNIAQMHEDVRENAEDYTEATLGVTERALTGAVERLTCVLNTASAALLMIAAERQRRDMLAKHSRQ